MDNSPLSISEALNHIQSWLNAKEYDKVIQGCGEILEMEPGNRRALALMSLAEEQRHQETEQIMDKEDPLANLQVESHEPTMPKTETPTQTTEEPPHIEKRKLFLAMLVPALMVVAVGGGVIYYLSNNNREEVIEEAITPEEPTNTEYLDENEDRINQMTEMGQVIEKYYLENGAYPSESQIERVFVQSEEFSKVPCDPRAGEIDKNGKPFDYIYAVYDSIAGEKTVYILSALFEDSKGFGYPWAIGENTKNYAKYRDTTESNVTVICEE